MKANELLKDIYGKFQTGEYLKVPSIQKKNANNHRYDY